MRKPQSPPGVGPDDMMRTDESVGHLDDHHQTRNSSRRARPIETMWAAPNDQAQVALVNAGGPELWQNGPAFLLLTCGD